MILFLKLLVSSFLLIFVFKAVDFTKIFSLLKNFDNSYIFIIILTLTFQIFIANIRWNILLKRLNYRSKFTELLQFLWVGIFFNQMLPSSIGGDAVRIYYLNKRSNSISIATQGVLLDRFFGVTGLSLLAFLVLFFIPNSLNDSIMQSGIIISSGVLGLVCIILLLDYLPFSLSKWRIIKGIKSMSFNGRNAIFSGYSGLTLIILSISIHLITVLVFIAISKGMALEISWLDMLSIIPLIMLLAQIPISIAGWGLREGMMILGLGYINIHPEQALALSILYGISLLLVSIPGGLIWLFNYKMKIK